MRVSSPIERFRLGSLESSLSFVRVEREFRLRIHPIRPIVRDLGPSLRNGQTPRSLVFHAIVGQA
jgi:hypothetical protein